MSAHVKINGEDVAVEGTDLITYEQVMDLAGLKGNPSCTWRDKEGRGGILIRGRAVTLRPGLIFNIVHTGAA